MADRTPPPVPPAAADAIADQFAEFLHQEGAPQRAHDFADGLISRLREDGWELARRPTQGHPAVIAAAEALFRVAEEAWGAPPDAAGRAILIRYAAAAAPILLAAGRKQAAADLTAAANGRREYAARVEAGDPPAALHLRAEAHTLDAAAKVADGDLKPMYGWLPSWRWTDEMNARLRAEEPNHAD